MSSNAKKRGPVPASSAKSTETFKTARESFSKSGSKASQGTSPAPPQAPPPSSPPPNQPEQPPVITEEPERDDNSFDLQNAHPWILLLLIFLSYILLLYLVYLTFPKISAEERRHIKIPRSMSDAQGLAKVLDHYKDDHYYTVLIFVGLFYLFLQTFAIPGSIFLSIMSGFLFPFWTALFLVCFCSATGATSCYLLSWLVAGPIVETYFTDTIIRWREKVNDERDNLFWFIIFLRITPILPNWLINIVAPQIGVPLGPFWLGSFFGVAPPSALAVEAGRTLNMLTSATDHISWGAVIVLTLIAILSLVPVLIKRWSQ